MSTHLHNPLTEKAEALEVALSYMLATVASVVLWSLIIGAITFAMHAARLLP